MSQKSTETETTCTEQYINISATFKGKDVQHIADDFVEFVKEHTDADVKMTVWRMDSGEQEVKKPVNKDK